MRRKPRLAVVSLASLASLMGHGESIGYLGIDGTYKVPLGGAFQALVRAI